MSLQLNQLTVAGNLTADPVLRAVGADRAVAHFTIATNRRWKDRDGVPHSAATFVACTAWSPLAELVAKHFAKGDPLYVQGRIELESWDGKDGGKNTRPVCVVDTVRFVESKERAAPAVAAVSAAGTKVDANGVVIENAPAADAADEPPF